MDAITYALSKKYTDNKIAESAGLHRQIVTSLPTTGDEKIIYMVRVSNDNEDSDNYNEYMWIDGNWELIGNTRVDLSDYYNKTQVDTALNGKANTSDIPTALSQLTADATHRLVTDTEKTAWNGKASSATTLDGYGITDAYTKSETDEIFVKPYKAGDSIAIEYGMPLYGFSFSKVNPVVRVFLPLSKPIVASNVNVTLSQANMQLITITGYESKNYSLLTITPYIKPNGLMLYIKGFDYSTEDRPVIVKLDGTITFS